MNSRMRNMRLLLFVPVVILLLGVWGCSKTPQRDIGLMNRAEELMETAPDSSLAIMESVDSVAVRGRADRARYALLMSMALDRNIIELKDFNVLQPAIDYYPKHGTPDERLKTRYYEGRIHMNRGDKEHALKIFLDAEADSLRVIDSLSLARLYIAQAVLYYYQYKLKDHILANSKAANIYLAHRDTAMAINSLGNMMASYAILKQRKAADSILNFINSLERKDPGFKSVNIANRVTYYTVFNDSANLSKMLNDQALIENADVFGLLQTVNGYIYLKKPLKARSMLDAITDAYGIVDSTQYLQFLSDIALLEGNYKDAYDYYQKSNFLFEKKNSELFQADILLIKDRHDKEIIANNRINKKNTNIYILLIILLLALILVIIITYRLKLTKTQKENIQKQNELLAYKVKDLEKEKRNLEEILDNKAYVPIESQKVLRQWLNEVNNLLVGAIQSKESFEKRYDKWRKDALSDFDSFLQKTYKSYEASHPEFIATLENKGMTEYELGICCLYVMGIRGLDIRDFSQNSRIYHISTTIRKKLGLESRDKNLGNYLRQLIKTEK